jgi:hypothetical protein
LPWISWRRELRELLSLRREKEASEQREKEASEKREKEASEKREKEAKAAGQVAQIRNKPRPRPASGFYGVTPNKKRWGAYLYYGGKQHTLGTFDTKQEAALAYPTGRQGSA